jgi:hypothetical protein
MNRYGYCRKSQTGMLMSLRNQAYAIQAYFRKRRWAFDPALQLYCDAPDTDSWRYVRCREAGHTLMGRLDPGDVVVLPTLNILLVDTYDLILKLKWFRDRAVELHLVDRKKPVWKLSAAEFIDLVTDTMRRASQETGAVHASRRGKGPAKTFWKKDGEGFWKKYRREEDGSVVPYIHKKSYIEINQEIAESRRAAESRDEPSPDGA